MFGRLMSFLRRCCDEERKRSHSEEAGPKEYREGVAPNPWSWKAKTLGAEALRCYVPRRLSARNLPPQLARGRDHTAVRPSSKGSVDRESENKGAESAPFSDEVSQGNPRKFWVRI